MHITEQQLRQIMPQATIANINAYTKPLNDVADYYHISDTAKRWAAFLAQVGHESLNLQFTKENLNYSAQGLLRTFPRYFNAAQANSYARNPERIANRVYANRMGNGNEASGDGWKYRGRGLIQLTGHDNYAKFASENGLILDVAITLLDTPQGAAMSAGWFWDERGLNSLADANRFTDITQRINGGQNGAADRLARYQRALSVLT